MTIFMEFELPNVEVQTDTGHAIIDHIWIDGKDYADKSAIDLFMALVGEKNYYRKFEQTAYDLELYGDI